MKEEIKAQLIHLFNGSVDAVAGSAATQSHLDRLLLEDNNFRPDLILSIGKAASGMCAGALSALEAHKQLTAPALLITKYQHTDQTMRDHPRVTTLEAAHPVPDHHSLYAGAQALQRVADLPLNSQLLLLVSGGTSSLTEILPPETSLEQWQQLTHTMLSSGFSISQINTRRKQISLIKDGKLLQAFKGTKANVLAISDVQGDDIAVIGSGTGDTKHIGNRGAIHLIGTNQVARHRAAALAKESGLKVLVNSECMYQDVSLVAQQIGDTLKRAANTADRGVYIFGGEPTVNLPENPGSGGRNQSLALALAIHIQGLANVNILVAGTDGSDGPTDAAGGIVDGTTANDIKAATLALSRADAGTYLRSSGDIFITGPTNTNVMDIVIAIVD